MDLSVNFCGVRLESPLMNASGCFSGETSQLDALASAAGVGAVVSKSGTLDTREGHAPPRLAMLEGASLNAMGLPNLGYRAYLAHHIKLVKDPYRMAVCSGCGHLADHERATGCHFCQLCGTGKNVTLVTVSFDHTLQIQNLTTTTDDKGAERPTLPTLEGPIHARPLAWWEVLLQERPFIQSLAPASAEELGVMLDWIGHKCAEHRVRPPMIELNLSCPNNEAAHDPNELFCGDLHTLRRFLIVVRQHMPGLIVGVKVPALHSTKQWDRLCALLLEFADALRYVTAINSVANCLAVDSAASETLLHAQTGFGGLGGAAVKPMGLASVQQLFRRVGGALAIVGCGGVSCAEDVLEYVLCGANAVQVGTHLLRQGVECFAQIRADLEYLLVQRKTPSLAALIGRLRPAPPAGARIRSAL